VQPSQVPEQEQEPLPPERARVPVRFHQRDAILPRQPATGRPPARARALSSEPPERKLLLTEAPER